MNYQTVSIWVFSILLVLFVFFFLFGYSQAALWIMLLAPLLVLWQAYAVLAAKKKPSSTFEENWYED